MPFGSYHTSSWHINDGSLKVNIPSLVVIFAIGIDLLGEVYSFVAPVQVSGCATFIDIDLGHVDMIGGGRQESGFLAIFPNEI